MAMPSTTGGYCLSPLFDTDAGGFKNWAAELGYDTDSRTDSRKAEKVYRECLETALKLRAGIGEEGLQKLREAFQDY